MSTQQDMFGSVQSAEVVHVPPPEPALKLPPARLPPLKLPPLKLPELRLPPLKLPAALLLAAFDVTAAFDVLVAPP